MQYKFLVEMPFASHNLKYGWESSKRYKQSRSLTLALLQGRTAVIKTQNAFEQSAGKGTTIMHYRDLLLSWALGQCLINTQYTDKAQNLLTTAASRTWQTYSYDDIWPYQNLSDSRPTFFWAGFLGEPAFWFTKNKQQDYALPLLEKACANFWAFQNIDYSLSPRAKMTTLVERLSIPQSTLTFIQTRWLDLFSQTDPTNNPELWELLIVARRSFLTADSVVGLTQKVIFGSYTQDFMNIVFNLLETEGQERLLQTFITNCTSLCKPTGLLLILQFFIIEGLTKASRLLTNLGAETLQQPLSYINNETAFTLAQCLALVFDAATIIEPYTNSFKPATAYQLLIHWLTLSKNTRIDEADNYRIAGLF